MKKTELAEKRLKIISGNSKCKLEAQFIREFVLNQAPSIKWNSGIELNLVTEFCERVYQHGGRVLGFHTSLDSPYPYICLPWELFFQEYDPDWVFLALTCLQKDKIERFIVPTCDFDLKTINALR